MDIEKMDKAKLAEACETALNCLRSMYDAIEDGRDADDIMKDVSLWPMSLLRAALNPDDKAAVEQAAQNWSNGEYIGPNPADDDDWDYEDEDDDFEEEIDHTYELDNGGCMEFDPTDGAIRYRDEWGNCENIWRVGDAEYNQVKSDYFPTAEVEVYDDDDSEATGG